MDTKLYSISHLPTSVDLKLTTPLKGTLTYSLSKPSEDALPVSFFTATTPMKDFIGNVTQIEGKKCAVRGVYEGIMREVKNIEIADEAIKSVGDRVMVTEHINTCGTFELLATKKRILLGDINFINIGWKIGNKSKYIRVDVYTGNHKLIED